MFRSLSVAVTLIVVCGASQIRAAEETDVKQLARIRRSVGRGLAIVQKAAANYPKHRKCFSCHHQTLPILAMTSARSRGIAIDENVLKTQLKFTRKSFRRRISQLKSGTGIGGRAMTVGYALWMLSLCSSQADDVTTAMVAYLLKTQKSKGHWQSQSQRPPLEESRITCTALAITGIGHFAEKTQRKRVKVAKSKARQWLSTVKPRTNEDRVMLLWSRHMSGEDAAKLAAMRNGILQLQNKDGGWAQKADMPSDAYATGQSLFLLRKTGLPRSSPAFRSGIEFLLRTQKPDGSWYVKTRSKPVQVFFDNGDPHGKNQFISIPATAWATAALATALPKR